MLFNGALFYYLAQDVHYTDTDCYTRALRIIDWLEEYQWSEKIFPYFNPPQGFVLHFTRICDVIWLALSAPFLPFMPLKDAVFYGGLAFSPLFMALSLAVIFWGIKPYLPTMPNRNIIFVMFSLICLYNFSKLSGTFDFTRPDHHSLMAFVMSAGVAVILRNHIRIDLRYLLISGILCGMGMWASSAIEGLFAVAVILSILAFNRIFYRHTGKELIYFSLGLFLSVTAAWLINPPYGGYAEIDINRLSVVHAALTALMFLAFLALNLIKTENKYILISAFGTAAGVCAGIMLLIFGTDNLFVSIYDPFVRENFVPYIAEMEHQSLFGYETPAFFFGAGTMLWLLYKDKGRQAYVTDMFIFFVCICLAALMYRRFFPYYVVIYQVVCGLALFILAYISQKSDKLKWVMLIYVVVPIMYLNSWYVDPPAYASPKLKSPVLAEIFEAPEKMFFDNVDTVGGPYHVDIEGIKDSHIMWFTTDENELKSLLKKHNVQTVYLPKNERPDYYVEPEKNTDKLYGKIMCDKDMYPWLIKQEEGVYTVDYTKF